MVGECAARGSGAHHAWHGGAGARLASPHDTTPMWLFRKSLDIRRAALRPLAEHDLTSTARLLRDGGRRYYGFSGGELARLLSAGQGVALDAAGELWGVAVTSWPAEQRCWLRAVAYAEGLDAQPALDALIPGLHAHLVDRGVRECYYAGDDAADGWLAPALRGYGYGLDTEVVVYEKRDWEIPDGGSRRVRVRPATPVDMAEVLRLDQACFEAQWTKDDSILAPAVSDGPFFVIAELDGAPVGYAYATSHFGGRLVHLVRIAVDPGRQGQGIGVRLLADVVAYASNQGADLITLNTQAYNTHAQRLYRWFGFVRTGERQIVLKRDLTADAGARQPPGPSAAQDHKE